MSTMNRSVTMAEQSPYQSRHGRSTGFSLSRSSFSTATHCVPPPTEALTTSPNMSVNSSSTRHSKTSTDKTRSSCRHFYSSSLGRPPGQLATQTTSPVPVTSSSFPLASSNKTMPVKEIQKLVTDLKKENFDLKLRLYYTEQQLEKDREKDVLEQDNYRLRMELEDQKKRLDNFERALSKQSCDASTQTINTKRMSSLPTTLSANSQSYFPSDPASFGLTCSSTTNLTSLARQKQYTIPILPHGINKMDMANIVDQFQNVKLHSPTTRHQISSPDTIEQGKVTGWLDKIIYTPIAPDHLPLSPSSVPSTTSSLHYPSGIL